MAFLSQTSTKKYSPSYLRREGLPSCCGAGIIHGFPEYRLYMDWREPNVRKYHLIQGKTVKESQEIVKGELEYYLQHPYSMEMVILNSTQRKYWEELLFKFDFEVVKDAAFHTYASLDLTTYMRTRYTVDDKRKITKDNRIWLPASDPRRTEDLVQYDEGLD